ncbi:MAG: hypothetical protein IPO13_13070 [Rhodocyclaceae bacterium]|nr:hypothetical protein [Rhodocyclaceae bacterium]
MFALSRLLLASLLWVSTSFAAQPVLPKQADISISNIVLHDMASQKQVLGVDIPFDKNADLPVATFSSADGRQFLTVSSHPGGLGEISEFRVSSSPGKNLVARRIASRDAFVTGKGIRLGLTKSQLVSRLGAPLRTKGNGNFVTLEYRIEDTEQNPSKFLRFYNMPIYYGSYTFKNNYLVAFKCGFDYP